MRILILILALLALSACGKAPAASTDALLSAAAPTVSPWVETASTCASLQMRAIHSTGNCIDVKPRATLNYTQAVASCMGTSLTVCTLAQYQGAVLVGAISYPIGGNNYWMSSIPGANRFTVTENYQATGQWPITDSAQYYCCANGVQ